MVAEALAWVDVESAVRQWARDVLPDVERRVFFEPNEKTDATGKAQVVLFRISGRDEAALIQLDVWARSKAQAAEIAAALASAAEELSRYAHGGALLLGAYVESVRWQPDEESGRPRYVVEITFTAVPHPAAEG